MNIKTNIVKSGTGNGLSNVLGLDYGENCIGAALGNNGIVVPLKEIPAKNINSALYEINKLIVENKIGLIVLGIPLTAEGQETKKSLEIRRFAKNLRVVTKRPVFLQNEFGTSKEALKEAVDLDIPKKKRKSNDSLAAALILKMYFDEHYNEQRK
jgi:putative Holliday junction resolvase